ncbi:site-specific integrase [Paraburkholderia humisilvae]|uniref:Tyrosine recombinase XerC n=1 Tax=Paraburkholderia humisilvae TaxID=627669 RepID=A0A6J5F6X7_9BURK|nr:site-specific integrase [Paraburkholderia humisilvae]CAB3774640.1 Tyrosine recombinase XerC [Paraburkholderia humisilvae]
MKTRQSSVPASNPGPSSPTFPGGDQLAALRGWYAGLSSRAAIDRYLSHGRAPGQSARGIISGIRQQLIAFACQRQRADVVELLQHSVSERIARANAVTHAIEVLRSLPVPQPQIGDDIGLWFVPRAARVLRAHGITTLADLTVRVPRRRRWWSTVPGLGQTSARQIEAFFAAHPQLTERARALIAVTAPGIVVPWEQLRVPHEVDGSHGSFRAPRRACALDANNDYDAVHAWLALHETPATQRAYRKEAERVILWSIVERGRALSSLTTEDAIAYRSFLRHPTPRERWIGPPRPRNAPDWRPFSGDLSARSTAYALSVLGALFRWLIEQRYVLTNPFAGIKVRGKTRVAPLDTSRGFTEGEWGLVRTIANGLEWSYGWEAPAAQRLRFLLDFSYATGLRASELVGARLGDIRTDELGAHWLNLVGKGGKPGKVAVPPLARAALEQYLVQRGLPVTPQRWDPKAPLLASFDGENTTGITRSRLWFVMRRFFRLAADVIGTDHPVLAEKLRRASPHWTRHTHATHALARGAELTTVRDNLRHASIATTSIYLQSDEVKRSRQMDDAFAMP